MTPAEVTLRLSLVAESRLMQDVKDGVGAMLSSDRSLIHTDDRPKVADSLDLDSATEEAFPNDHRWDYILSLPGASKLVGLEPHTAGDHEVRVVIRKKQNAQAFLRDHLRPGRYVREWYWVTAGRVGFSRMDRAKRALDQNGITFGGRFLRLRTSA
jgi:hypothetical protein